MNLSHWLNLLWKNVMSSQPKYKIKKKSSGNYMFEKEKVNYSLFFTLQFVKCESLLIITAQDLQNSLCGLDYKN